MLGVGGAVLHIGQPMSDRYGSQELLLIGCRVGRDPPTDLSLTTEQQGTGSTSTPTPPRTGIQTSQISQTTNPNGPPNLPTIETMAGPQLGSHQTRHITRLCSSAMKCNVVTCYLASEAEKILKEIRLVQLSDSTATRQCGDLGSDVSEQLITDLNEAPCFSIALDETTDVRNIAQRLVWVRFPKQSDGVFREEMLCFLPLEGHTRAGGTQFYPFILIAE
ncbi:UNVERIFIED_CONTAM: hypothetical protein FKN15_051007 [Acipenser sinensis]